METCNAPKKFSSQLTKTENSSKKSKVNNNTIMIDTINPET